VHRDPRRQKLCLDGSSCQSILLTSDDADLLTPQGAVVKQSLRHRTFYDATGRLLNTGSSIGSTGLGRLGPTRLLETHRMQTAVSSLDIFEHTSDRIRLGCTPWKQSWGPNTV
jgi:hypothetical protein